MGLEHNGTVTQYTWYTKGLGHNTLVDLVHNGTGTQRAWDTMGK